MFASIISVIMLLAIAVFAVPWANEYTRIPHKASKDQIVGAYMVSATTFGLALNMMVTSAVAFGVPILFQRFDLPRQWTTAACIMILGSVITHMLAGRVAKSRGLGVFAGRQRELMLSLEERYGPKTVQVLDALREDPDASDRKIACRLHVRKQVVSGLRRKLESDWLGILPGKRQSHYIVVRRPAGWPKSWL